MTDLLAGTLVARILLHLVVVLMIQRRSTLPKAVLAQLIAVASRMLTAIAEAREVLSLARGAHHGMDDALDGRQAMQQSEPNETGVTRLTHHRSNEIVDCQLALHRKQLVLESLVVVKCRRLVDSGWKGENLSNEIDGFPMNQLAGAIRDLRENVCVVGEGRRKSEEKS